MSAAAVDQLLVALCVLTAVTYLARRQWLTLRNRSEAKGCGGGCGCAKRTTAPPRPPA